MAAFTTVFEQPRNYEHPDNIDWNRAWICTIA